MPTSDRKYAKQNLQRASKLCDNILEYLIATGKAFLEQSDAYTTQGKEIPEDYLRIIGSVDLIVDSVDTIKTVIVQLEDSF